jgi:C1A family cysteine protease
MKKNFVVWCFCLFLTGSLGLLFVQAQNDLEPKIAPLNPAFLKAIEEMQAGKFYQGEGLGYIPSPVDRSYYKGVYDERVRAGYPVSYDLRTYNKVTPVKNQGGCGSCWAFGAFGSLESWIKPTETGDFSEQHLISNHGFDWTECAGGNTDMSEAYLARWGGPYNESEYPYIYSSGNAIPPQKHVQTVIWLPGRTSSTDNDTIKYFVMTYGAVTFAFYYDASYVQSTYKTYYYPSSHSSNHEVCFIGWDDNFDKNKFTNVPPGNGAFLCKNSWGTSHWSTDNGYFWLSYYDATIGDLCSFIDAQSPANYKYNYQYDPLGATWGFGYGTTTAWGANIFTASTNDPLRAIGFITNDKCNVTYSIYKNPTAGNPASGSLMATATIGTYNYAGYYTYKLLASIALATNDTFSVVIKYVNNSYTYPIPAEGYVASYTTGVTNASGQSFYSSNGTSWTDFTSYNSNANKLNCTIKAFTGFTTKNDFNRDGQEDILWRYYGPGGYNSVWYMGTSGSGLSGLQTINSRVINMFQAGAPAKVYWDAREVGDLQNRTVDKVYGDAREAGGSLSGKEILLIPDGQLGKLGQAKGIRILKSPVENMVGPLGVPYIGEAALPLVADLHWQIAGTGDFNGDGKVDILWRYYGSGGYNYVWSMNGVTCTGGAMLPSVTDMNWQIVGTGDFNGDGKVDILWRYYGAGGYNYVWYMDGATCAGGAFLPSVTDLKYQIVGTGDFNGDGKVDILWRYYGAGGYNAVWYLNGVTYIGAESLTSVLDLNWRIVNR